MSTNTNQIEYYIVKSLLQSDAYVRTYISKLNPELFSTDMQSLVRGIVMFYKRNGKSPPVQLLEDVVLPKVCMGDLEKAKSMLETCLAIEVPFEDMNKFMADETKKFIKTQSVMNAFVKCMDFLEKEDHEKIVSTMEGVFSINFDESLGLDYFEDLETRLERSSKMAEIITTGIPSLDNMIGGGYRRKSLFVFAGPANSGKSLVLNDAASTLAFGGYNVLYLTLELSEDYISQRTDAKFSGVSMNIININPGEAIKKAILRRDSMKTGTKKIGKLIYKEYAPNSVSCNDIRGLLKSLELKKDFIPDFIIVDYLKLIKPCGKLYADNMYGKLGTVCEELRGLSMEYNCCVLSASQTGRQSYNASSMGMEDVADSIGISQTADVMVMLLRSREDDTFMGLQLAKSRFSKNDGKITTKIDFDHMRLVDMEALPTPADKLIRPTTNISVAAKPVNPKIEDDFTIDL